MSNLLSAESVYSYLPAETNIRLYVYDSIDSTNTEAKRRCGGQDCAALHQSVIIAGSQTAGRGRMGRPFYSPSGTGLYLSLIYCPENGVTKPAVMTASAAVGVCRALKNVYGTDARIKWVNDIFLNGRKVCGILTEGVTDCRTGRIDAAIVGIGVNISSGERGFPGQIASVAGSVLGTTDADTQRSKLAAEIIREVFGIYNSSVKGIASAMEEYREKSLLIGKTVTVSPVIGKNAENYTALVTGITGDAELVVKMTDGSEKKLESGEVSIGSLQTANL